jgi:N-acetyl-alpha-D-muramate 1-phosphate uridylyltransferase
MRAIILAAGRGERMRPLTDTTPKPLLEVHGKPLIVWHIEALAAAGVRDIVINCAWLAAQFPATLGDGSAWGVRLHYSIETQALETAGGIAQALPLLTADGDDCFWAVSGDIHMPGFVFDAQQALAFAAGSRLAHLWMVPCSTAHPQGDFGIDAQGLALSGAEITPRHVFGNIGLYRRGLLDAVTPGQRLPLRPCFEAGIARRAISAQLYTGPWVNVGTPEQLLALGHHGDSAH